ncbi:hypothetical protein BMS3Abin16_01099 [archaeon BMS3Abin16]|nr:hypothetical protein BMS3Abin16_01099 [archaeon BMS3Abin16]
MLPGTRAATDSIRRAIRLYISGLRSEPIVETVGSTKAAMFSFLKGEGKLFIA